MLSVTLAGIIVGILAACDASAGLRGPDAAEVVRRGAAHEQRQQELEESVIGLQRRECERRPTLAGCAELLDGAQGLLRSPGVAQLRRAIPGSGGEAGGPFGAENLRRDDGPSGPGWRAAAPLPQELIFELVEPALLDRVAFRQTQAAVPEAWAREVELLLSEAAPDAGYVSVGRWTLRQTTAPQQFAFRPLRARYVRLRVLARHGEGDTVALGAFALGKQGTDQSPLLTGP